MRWISIIILGLCLGGCGTQPAPVASEQLSDNARYGRNNAGALAFDPPVLAGQSQLDLSREGRQPQAFAGFEDSVTTYYDITTYDSQNSGPTWNGSGWGGGDQYQRNAYMEKVGVNTH
jgi:hypothetical protein